MVVGEDGARQPGRGTRAARYLCAAGAGTVAGLPGAIFAYNHASWYVAEVLALAQQYARVYG